MSKKPEYRIMNSKMDYIKSSMSNAVLFFYNNRNLNTNDLDNLKNNAILDKQLLLKKPVLFADMIDDIRKIVKGQ